MQLIVLEDNVRYLLQEGNEPKVLLGVADLDAAPFPETYKVLLLPSSISTAPPQAYDVALISPLSFWDGHKPLYLCLSEAQKNFLHDMLRTPKPVELISPRLLNAGTITLKGYTIHISDDWRVTYTSSPPQKIEESFKNILHNISRAKLIQNAKCLVYVKKNLTQLWKNTVMIKVSKTLRAFSFLATISLSSLSLLHLSQVRAGEDNPPQTSTTKEFTQLGRLEMFDVVEKLNKLLKPETAFSFEWVDEGPSQTLTLYVKTADYTKDSLAQSLSATFTGWEISGADYSGSKYNFKFKVTHHDQLS